MPIVVTCPRCPLKVAEHYRKVKPFPWQQQRWEFPLKWTSFFFLVWNLVPRLFRGFLFHFKEFIVLRGSWFGFQGNTISLYETRARWMRYALRTSYKTPNFAPAGQTRTCSQGRNASRIQCCRLCFPFGCCLRSSLRVQLWVSLSQGSMCSVVRADSFHGRGFSDGRQNGRRRNHPGTLLGGGNV